MKKYFLAIDIGASGGRHILGHMENQKMHVEEIYRFYNGMVEINGTLCWDIEKLFREIITGMKKCAQLGKIPVSMGIDSWAVDFVLLDKDDHMLGNAVAYRDSRTNHITQKVHVFLSEEELYQRTGIQKQNFNTIYQLMAVKEQHRNDFSRAESMLMIPDYFHFLLTGKKATEYTNATTTQLIDHATGNWDKDLIRMLGYPESVFQKILMPGTELGYLNENIQKLVGYNCKVILPATHDTGSAVMAVPSTSDHTLYISSGTWSLMGTERMTADCSQKSRKHNFTNEGGYDYRFRYLKNIMGLWMIQSVKKEIGGNLNFGEICNMASRESIGSIIDCNESRFLAPKNMMQEIQKACRETHQEVPQGIGQVASVIYHSLAHCYAQTKKEIEEMTQIPYDIIHVVGGGSNATYLNELTAKETGCRVYAGPTEATAIGNLAAQMIKENELKNLMEARNCILHSFEINIYEPE